jgi:feruloyl esterase
MALFAAPCFAANCESLTTLSLPHTTITKAEVIATGTFAPPTGKPLQDLPAFCRVTATVKPSADSDILVENDPGKCQFDPSSLQCKSAGQEKCLTAAQVETAKQIYAGPVNPRTGQSLYPGLPRGSEFGWDGLDPTPGGTPPYAPIFQWVFGAQWDWRRFDFDRDYSVYTQKLAEMVNATSPDIDAFRAHGHKLLMYHGWSDWLVAPGESINYYNAVVARDSSAHSSKPQDALDQSFRLFMVPGMAHCAGGPGETHFDALGAVVDWVEHGVAPDKIIASKLPIAEMGAATNVQRPLCPYPRAAQYQGSGSTNDASSFVCR